MEDILMYIPNIRHCADLYVLLDQMTDHNSNGHPALKQLYKRKIFPYEKRLTL